MFSKQFGGKACKELITRYEQSPNWKGGKFQNLEETNTSVNFWEIPELLYKQFFYSEQRAPKTPLPVAPFDKERFLADGQASKFVWYGHSVLLMRVSGKTILLDPMLGPDAAPITPANINRFSENTLDLIDQFPTIDLLLLSHDHYDHLDYDSIQKLKGKTKQYFVGLGIKRHLVDWGVEPDLISEFDWWDNGSLDDISITFTPSRHYSGRSLLDTAQSLWGGWVFKTATENIWFSGDGGYGKHFAEVGKRLGPFDFAFIECGQYNEKWAQLHMFPEESVQAALDGKAKKVMPIHWSGFALAQHDWKEPAHRFAEACKRKGLDSIYPKLGEVFSPESDLPDYWWHNL